MIFIWTSDKPDRVRQALQSVLQNYKEVKVGVGNQLPDFTGMSKVVVIALGNENREKLSSQGVFKPKNKTLTALRKTAYQLPGTAIPVLFSYSPSIREIDYGKHVDLLTDVNLAFRVYLTGSPLPQLGDYQYVKDFSGTLARIKELHEKTELPVRSSLDLETLGLDPYRLPSLHPTDPSLNHPGAYIVSIQISCEPGKTEIVAFHSRQAMAAWIEAYRWQLEELLNSEIIWMVGANLKYDLHWLAVHAKVECTNFRFDTTLVGSLLDENRSNGLDVHAKVYTGLGGYSDAFDAKADKSRMDLELAKDPQGFGIYAGGDTDACLQVAMAEREQLLQDEELTRFYINILHPASRAFEMIERGGVLIDMDRFNELEATVNAEIDMLLAKAKPMIGGRLIAKHQDLSKRGGVNLTKASLLIDFFFSPAGLNLKPKMFTAGSEAPGAEQVPSTSMDHLKMFRDVPEAKPVIEVLEAYGSATKVMSTYITGFRKHIRSDGRFHPNYWLFAANKKEEGEGGTVSGRLSARDPAFQCLKGDTPVLTDKGWLPIESIVKGYETGDSYKVLTHTGKWRRVVNVYRNGVQPVFNVLSETGKMVVSTANHPYLTHRGWVRTDQLHPGDTCYELRAPNKGLHQSNLLFMDCHEEPVQQSYEQGLSPLRGQGHHGLRPLADLHQLSCRHGGKAGQGVVDRAQGSERELRTEQLPMGVALDARGEPAQYKTDYLQWGNQAGSAMGAGAWDFSREIALPAIDWFDDGTSLDEGEAPNRDTFQESRIVSITPAGDCETFDLTIEGSHSFVANGVVVHNTIPKHSKWAILIRMCYIAPPGYFVLENDYSQGELRVIACLAHEQVMIQAYLQGQDLHALTGGRIAGYEYADMMAMKDSGDPAKVEIYERLRQMAKPMNFGLIYGMMAEGFRDYTYYNYGIPITLEEAHTSRNTFFETYSALPIYHRNIKQFAHTHGYVRSPLGRIRHLPLIDSPNWGKKSTAERQAINSPTQSTLTDMMVWGMALGHQRGYTKEAPYFGQVHDAGYTYIPQDNYLFHAKRQKDLMEQLPFETMGWNPQLTFPVDSKFGPSMGELQKVKF